MVLLINTSNLKKGGGIQVALSIIKESIRFPENEYHVFLCPSIFSQLDQKSYPKNFHFYHIKNSPSSPVHGIEILIKLNILENRIKPDCVFTIFGPSYWTPHSKHLMGYAIPLYVYQELLTKIDYLFIEGKVISFKRILHKYFLKRNADYYYTETSGVSRRLSKFLDISEKRIFTVGNTFSHVFNDPIVISNILPKKNAREFRL